MKPEQRKSRMIGIRITEKEHQRIIELKKRGVYVHQILRGELRKLLEPKK